MFESLERGKPGNGAVAQETPHPTVIVIPRFGQDSANGKSNGRVQGGKRGAAVAPLVWIAGLVGPLTAGDKLQGVGVDDAEGSGFHHCANFAVSIIAVE